MANLFELVGRIVIDAEDGIETIDDVTGKASALAKTLGGVGAESEKTSKQIGSNGKFGAASVWVGNMFTRLATGAARLGKTLVKTGFGFDASMEVYNRQFEALLGNSDKASKLVSDLQKLAKISPLGMEGLAKNAVALVNQGVALEDIIPTLEMLGNLALGNPTAMDSIVRAYTQIMSKGLLMAQEMYQLGDAGVPFKEIMTMYGGERYADGSWYMEKMTDPTYKIEAEDLTNAFLGATAEGGKWHNYMFKMMDTWSGQVDRMGEEGKESLGAFMNPFFEVAKAKVLPELTEELSAFGTWVTENKETIEAFAKSLGEMVTNGFNGLVNAFKWIMENGETVSALLTGISIALAVSAIAAHPYAAAIMAIVAGLAMLTQARPATDEAIMNEWFGGYTQEDIDRLNEYIRLRNEAMAGNGNLSAANDYKVDNLDNGILGAYDKWRMATAGGAWNREEAWLPVPVGASAESEGIMQSTLQGMDLETEVPLTAASGSQSTIQSQLNSMNFMASVTLFPDSAMSMLGDIAADGKIDGSHANGLDRVPFDNYRATLHKNEAVLTASEAEAWRSGSGMGGTARLEGLMQQMLNGIREMNMNARAGTNIVLDSGVLVGQLTPGIDAKLGTLSKRKGRG